MVTKLKKRQAAPQDARQQIAARFTHQEAQAIDRLVHMGFFLNRSDFLRSTVREKLSMLQVESIRDVSRQQAQDEILNYLKSHAFAYPSDIASELQLDLALVMDVVQDLLKKRKAEEVA